MKKCYKALQAWVDLAKESLWLHREEAFKQNKPGCKFKDRDDTAEM